LGARVFEFDVNNRGRRRGLDFRRRIENGISALAAKLVRHRSMTASGKKKNQHDQTDTFRSNAFGIC
jgi:hypothetical protein